MPLSGRPQKIGSAALRSYGRRRCTLGKNFSDTADLRAYSTQFLLDVLVAPVNMVNPVDDGFAVGHQSRQHQ
jgi:hypothetical protein